MYFKLFTLICVTTLAFAAPNEDPKAIELVQYLKDNQAQYLRPTYIAESSFPYLRSITPDQTEEALTIPTQDGVNVLNIADGAGTKIVYIKNFPSSRTGPMFESNVNPALRGKNPNFQSSSISSFQSNVNGQQTGGVAGQVNGKPFAIPFGFNGANGINLVPSRFGDDDGDSTTGGNLQSPFYPGFGGPGFGGPGFGGPGFGGPGFGGAGFGFPGFGLYPPYGAGYGPYGPGFVAPPPFGFGGFGGPYGPGFGGPGYPGYPPYGPGPFFEQNKKEEKDDKRMGGVNPNHELFEDRKVPMSKESINNKKEPVKEVPTKRPMISTRKPELTTITVTEKKN